MTEKIAPTLAELKKNFHEGITRPASYRKLQLAQLERGVREMRDELTQGMLEDLGRNRFFTEIGELNGIIDYCHFFVSNMDEYMKDVYFDTALALAPSSARIQYEPLGVALIMGSWNYPYYVCLKPLV